MGGSGKERTVPIPVSIRPRVDILNHDEEIVLRAETAGVGNTAPDISLSGNRATLEGSRSDGTCPADAHP